jgi:hypothetical protein
MRRKIMVDQKLVWYRNRRVQLYSDVESAQAAVIALMPEGAQIESWQFQGNAFLEDKPEVHGAIWQALLHKRSGEFVNWKTVRPWFDFEKRTLMGYIID